MEVENRVKEKVRGAACEIWHLVPVATGENGHPECFPQGGGRLFRLAGTHRAFKG